MVLFFFTQGWNNPGLEFANAFGVSVSGFGVPAFPALPEFRRFGVRGSAF
jgi:hypothetical protein